MGINFSRLLSLKYGSAVASYLGTKYQSISVGRVMTCVLGMVVRREREIRSFVKTPFYRVIAGLSLNGRNFEGEWRAVKGSRYFNSPLLYKENGFQKKEDAQKLIEELSMQNPLIPHVLKMERCGRFSCQFHAKGRRIRRPQCRFAPRPKTRFRSIGTYRAYARIRPASTSARRFAAHSYAPLCKKRDTCSRFLRIFCENPISCRCRQRTSPWIKLLRVPSISLRPLHQLP